jgi:hypothetical protein
MNIQFDKYVMKKNKYTESDLAEKIIKYLESNGWTSYKEVSMRGCGGDVRSDSYFIKKNGEDIIETMALETKMSFSLKVIEQSDKWKAYSNTAYVCIPSPKRATRKGLLFGLKVCKSLNIGVFEVNMDTGIIKELNTPIPNKNSKIPPLYEQQRNSIAGNNKSSFITSFKVTVMNIEEYMKDKDGIELKDIISNIKHHYKNNKSALNTIKKMINENIIKGFFLKKEDNKILIFKIT